MVRCICPDWGGTLMAEDGPQDRAMALWPQVEAMPDAHATLAALGAHWPLHIATNQRQWRRPSTASKEVLGRHSQRVEKPCVLTIRLERSGTGHNPPSELRPRRRSVGLN